MMVIVRSVVSVPEVSMEMIWLMSMLEDSG
jgi:hypothetical protein